MECRLVMMPQLVFLPITINSWTTMAPNLALSKYILIQNIISSKSHDKQLLKDDNIAKTANCSDRTVYGI
jgi:hypothetical protein